MASVNKAIIVGHLGQDPEVRYLPDGTAVANLSIATSEKYKDKAGNMVEHTEWHKVSFFGRTAEVCGEYLAKGSFVYVEGSIRTEKWTDKEGQERYTTKIKGDRMQMLGGKDSGEREQPTQGKASRAAMNAQQPSARGTGFDDMDDDLPF